MLFFNILSQVEKDSEEKKVISTTGELVSFAFDIGFSIAIPIVVMVFLGRLADKYWGTSPWLMIAGLLLSIVSTSYIIYKKTKRLL